MSEAQVEVNPDDPIVELPMEIRCSVCDTLIRTDTANWPKSHIKRMENFSSWTGVVVSHGYCFEHNPNSSSPANE